MDVTRRNILVTGSPGVGKTTLVKRVGHELSDLQPAGFITEEIRVCGVRKGFSLRSFDGRSGTLAHVNEASPFRVGKYGVDVAGFERFLGSIGLFESPSRLIILDEIGKMECYSKTFREKVPLLFTDEQTILVATIARRGEGLISELRRRPDVTLFVMGLKNRDLLVNTVVASVRRAIEEL